MIWRALASVLFLGFAGAATANQTYLVIVSGLGGEERYREKFHDWSLAMRDAALENAAIPEGNVFYLAEKEELAPELVHAKSTKDNVIAVFEPRGEFLLLAKQVDPVVVEPVLRVLELVEQDGRHGLVVGVVDAPRDIPVLDQVVFEVALQLGETGLGDIGKLDLRFG